jgi:hypothetical protein
MMDEDSVGEAGDEGAAKGPAASQQRASRGRPYRRLRGFDSQQLRPPRKRERVVWPERAARIIATSR